MSNLVRTTTGHRYTTDPSKHSKSAFTPTRPGHTTRLSSTTRNHHTMDLSQNRNHEIPTQNRDSPELAAKVRTPRSLTKNHAMVSNHHISATRNLRLVRRWGALLFVALLFLADTAMASSQTMKQLHEAFERKIFARENPDDGKLYTKAYQQLPDEKDNMKDSSICFAPGFTQALSTTETLKDYKELGGYCPWTQLLLTHDKESGDLVERLKLFRKLGLPQVTGPTAIKLTGSWHYIGDENCFRKNEPYTATQVKQMFQVTVAEKNAFLKERYEQFGNKRLAKKVKFENDGSGKLTVDAKNTPRQGLGDKVPRYTFENATHKGFQTMACAMVDYMTNGQDQDTVTLEFVEKVGKAKLTWVWYVFEILGFEGYVLDMGSGSLKLYAHENGLVKEVWKHDFSGQWVKEGDYMPIVELLRKLLTGTPCRCTDCIEKKGFTFNPDLNFKMLATGNWRSGVYNLDGFKERFGAMYSKLKLHRGYTCDILKGKDEATWTTICYMMLAAKLDEQSGQIRDQKLEEQKTIVMVESGYGSTQVSKVPNVTAAVTEAKAVQKFMKVYSDELPDFFSNGSFLNEVMATKLFLKLNKSQQGVVLADFKAWAKGKGITEERIHEIFNNVDTDKNESLDAAEFTKAHFMVMTQRHGNYIKKLDSFCGKTDPALTASSSLAKTKKFGLTSCYSGCGRSSTPQKKVWTIDAANDKITNDTGSSAAYISKSFQEVTYGHEKGGQKRIFVKFSRKGTSRKGKFANRYFTNDEQTRKFLKYIQDICKEYQTLATTTSNVYCPKSIQDDAVKVSTQLTDEFLASLNVRRRRMAQREFSNRRDSPVMVRLLQQIVDAQDD